MGILSRVVRLIDTVNARLGWVFAFMLVPLAGVMVSEVFMRYVLNRPSVWAYEMSSFIFGGYIVLGGAYTLLVNGHVNVDILYSHRSPRIRALLDILTAMLFFLFIRYLLRHSFMATVDSWRIRELTNSHWHPPYYPLRTTLPVACVLMMLQGLAKFIRDVYRLVSGKDLP